VREHERPAEQLFGKQTPLTTVNVSSTKAVVTSRNRKRSSVRSGGIASARGSGSRRRNRFSRLISASACNAATMNNA
jgi:hypothetical protein